MGKYLKKSKTDGALMDVSPSSSSLGVLTRAKSLALQRHLQKPSLPTRSKKVTDCGGSYLQLRSRRLQKKPPIVVIERRKHQQRSKDSCVRNPNPRSDSVAESGKDKGSTSFDEKSLELQGSLERSTRESTSCTLKTEPEINTTLGSSTNLSENNEQREESLSGSHRPTTPDMDRFFSGAEEEQQRLFIEKYNFDPVNEQPLPGRFEWEKVDN